MNAHVLLLAKDPVPGRVKTRLCPPCTPAQAATIATAAIADTMLAVEGYPALSATLVLDTVPSRARFAANRAREGTPSARFAANRAEGGGPWSVVAQRGGGLDERLAGAFADAVPVGEPALLIGMDTPQVTPDLLAAMSAGLIGADACLGPAADGGWWALLLRDPGHAALLRGVETSTERTGELTLRALEGGGLTVRVGPVLTDVDTYADALVVAATIPDSRFAGAVAAVSAGAR